MDVSGKWLDSSSENLNNVEEKGCLFRSLLSRKGFREEKSNREKETVYKAASDFETSTSGYGDWQGKFEGILPFGTMEGFTSDMSPLPSPSEMTFSSSRRKRSSLKSRRFNSQLIKPRTSLESCLMAQFYEEHDIEKYDRHPLGKPDGSNIISTPSHESFSLPIGTETGKFHPREHECEYSDVKATVCGVPRLPNVVTMAMGLRKKAKTRHKEKPSAEGIDSAKGGCGDHDNARGTSNRALLFYLGLTMGIVSSFLANKQEVENMKCLLKQTENLVQDLQEEIQMKDSLTVKELAAEDYESQDVQTDHYVDDTVNSLSFEEKFDEEYCGEKTEEKSLNEIEAELEAELQRLESSMQSSSLEGKLCNTELDELYTADRNGSHSSTPRSCHYAVSPMELSLRLHQVIQSRLEERIKELEMALRKKMEAEHVDPLREVSNSKTRTSSTYNSPITREEHDSAVDQPIIINLSGEALPACNEAYEEFSKISESDEEDLQNGVDRCSSFNGNNETVFDGLTEEDLYSRAWEDGDGDEEEMERQLIKQIVEKAKQGSPAVLKAQRAFLLVNLENNTI